MGNFSETHQIKQMATEIMTDFLKTLHILALVRMVIRVV